MIGNVGQWLFCVKNNIWFYILPVGYVPALCKRNYLQKREISLQKHCSTFVDGDDEL